MLPERLAVEQEALAAELARRLWAANGGAATVSADEEASIVVLETLVARYLTPGLLRATAGLKHLQRLEEATRAADYEDVAALRAEQRWVDGYLTEAIFRTGDAVDNMRREMDGTETLDPEGLDASEPEGAAKRLEGLYREMTALVQAELKAAEIAA